MRFQKDRQSLVKTIVRKSIKKNQNCSIVPICIKLNNNKSEQLVEEEEEDLLSCTPPSNGKAWIAEQGVIERRRTALTQKIKARLSLQLNRYAVFSSPDYKVRKSELRIPEESDPTSTNYGLLRSAFDPTYRDRVLGNVWRYTDGVDTKEELKKLLEKEAKDNYLRDMRQGRYSIGKSKLAKSYSSDLRRSERLKSKLEIKVLNKQ